MELKMELKETVDQLINDYRSIGGYYVADLEKLEKIGLFLGL